MTNRPSAAIESAWVALMRSQQAVQLKVERAFRNAGFPPASWYDVLWELEKAGDAGLRPIQIERRRLITQSNISRLIDKLENNAYVTRRPCPDDGRGQEIVITSAGKDLRARMWPVYAGALGDALGQHLSDHDAATIASLLTRLCDPQ